jgi:hypothetical protein
MTYSVHLSLRYSYLGFLLHFVLHGSLAPPALQGVQTQYTQAPPAGGIFKLFSVFTPSTSVDDPQYLSQELSYSPDPMYSSPCRRSFAWAFWSGSKLLPSSNLLRFSRASHGPATWVTLPETPFYRAASCHICLPRTAFLTWTLSSLTLLAL